MASAQKSIHRGVELLQRGKHTEAAEIYRSILKRDPGNADALHLLAVALFQLGQAQRAAELGEKAVRANSRVPDYHSNLGRYYLSLGRLTEAAASLERALKLKPDHTLAHFNLALTQQGQANFAGAEQHLQAYLALNPTDPAAHYHLGNIAGSQYRFEDARACFERVLQLQPEQPEAWNNLGNAEQQLGRWRKALECYEKSLSLRPGYADAMSNRGAALQALGDLIQARSCYEKALELNPDMLQARGNLANLLAAEGRHEEAVAAYRTLLEQYGDTENSWNNMGNSYQEIGQFEEALACYQKALALNPAAFTIYNNIGNCYRRQGHHAEALGWYQKALECWPDFAEALNNSGVTLQDMGRLADAVPYFERALAVRADYPDPLINLSNNYRDRGRPEQAIACLRKAAEIRQDNPHIWNNLGCSLGDQGLVQEAIDCYRKTISLDPRNHHAFSNLLLNLHYLDDVTPDQIFNLHCEYERRFAPVAPAKDREGRSRDPERKLRVGYVSSDFRRHSVAYFLEPLLERHDPLSVEFYCYADVPRADALTGRFAHLAGPRWRDIRGYNDDRLEQLIRADAIDILVDLGGHTAGNHLRIFCRRPAPLQVTWLGYPDTTGLTAMDYRITDPASDPLGTTDHWYTERLVRLEDGFLCFRPAPQTPLSAPPPMAASGAITYGSFNNMAKMSPSVIRLWSELLHRVPASRLALKNKALAEGPARGRVIEVFKQRGIAEDRIVMSGAVESLEGHLSSYAHVDVALDSYPYHGTTTTFEALWMGVPVVTLTGPAHVSRVGASILSHVGLEGCIASTPEDYITCAASWAGRTEELALLRGQLRARLSASPLMDEPGFARRMESAYRTMWRRWCAGDPAAPLSIPKRIHP
ncbi:MAG: tetratricopeptide repeat protein [Acidobacteriota bacterium]